MSGLSGSGVDLTGRVVLVTGAANGIGRATAELLAARGATVVLSDLSSAGDEVVQGIVAAGGSAAFLAGDVTDRAYLGRLVDYVQSQHGQLHALVNNAGILRLADSFELTSDDYFDQMIAVNLRAVFDLSRLCLPLLKAAQGSAIVNTASMVGYQLGMPSHAVYGASKAAVVGLSRTMALELAPFKITVNCVAPGVVATNLFVEQFLQSGTREQLDAGSAAVLAAIPNGAYAVPAQIAEVITFLASPAADYVTGQTILIDGGYTSQ